ncbi:MAG: hypothetical protein WCA16_04945 [Candidatus Sulfotelmatobacter sp.]
MARSIARRTLLPQAILVGLLLVPLAVASDSDSKYQDTHTDARDFVAGGMVHLRLRVGDLQIRRGDSNRIRLRYTVKSRHERNIKETQVDFEVRGNDASIEFRAPGSNTQVDVELEVPPTTNLDVHQKVGDLSVEDIEGDKDLDLSVGDIHVANGHSGYRLVHASTSIGDVNCAGYGESSGWLGKTLKYQGDGKFELRAHVSVGDITLQEK